MKLQKHQDVSPAGRVSSRASSGPAGLTLKQRGQQRAQVQQRPHPWTEESSWSPQVQLLSLVDGDEGRLDSALL